jgi:hypothetical protein
VDYPGADPIKHRLRSGTPFSFLALLNFVTVIGSDTR